MAKKTPRKDGKDKLYVDVVDATLDFHQRRLWNRVDSDDPISVRLDGEEHPMIVSVLGSEGGEIGVSIMRGENAMGYFEEVLRMNGRAPLVEGCELLSMTFDVRSSVNPDFMRPLSGCGRVFGKHASVPTFFSAQSGMQPTPMSRPDLRTVLGVLRTLLAAASGGQLLTRKWDWRRRVLELVMEGKGKKAQVIDSVVTWPETGAGEAPEVRTPVLDQHWYDGTKAAPQTMGTWGVAVLPSPGVRDNPKALEILLARDEASGLALPPQIIEVGNPEALAMAFLELVKTGPPADGEGGRVPGLPRRVRFLQEPLALQLGAALDELGIPFSVDPEQEELIEAVTMLHDAMRQTEPLSADDASAESIHKWKDADRGMTDTLVEAGRIDRKALLNKHALMSYFGDAKAGRALVTGESESGADHAYVHWFLFHYRARAGTPTVAERLRDQRRFGIVEQAVLEASIAAKTVIGQVVSTDPGASFDLENSLTGEIHTIHDFALSKSAPTGLGLIVELSTVKEWNFVTMAGPAIPPFAIEQTIERIESLGGVFEDGVLRGDQYGLGALFLDPPQTPTIRNSEGEDLEFLTLAFQVKPGTDVEALLSELPDVEQEGDNQWALTIPGPQDKAFERGVIAAQFELVGDELLAHVNSRPRAERVRGLLGSQKGLKFTSMGETTSPELAGSPGAAGRMDEIEMSPEVQEQLTKMLQERAMGWLDEPVPALGGKTPREAAEDPSLRQKVERMIRTYPAASGPGGSIPAPKEEMLKQLGFE